MHEYTKLRDGRGPLTGGDHHPLLSPVTIQKNKKGLCRKEKHMNNPEYSPAILFDDTAFEIGDMAEITLTIGESLAGKISSIEKETFSIDVPEKNQSKIYTYRYSDVMAMKMLNTSK